MNIQFASDLHLEMPLNREYMRAHPIIPKADILVLAGDIIYLNDWFYQMKIIDTWSQQFEAVYIVPGNHEYYNQSFPISKSLPSLNYQIRDNVFVVNNQSLIIEDTRLLFSTLFTEIPSREAWAIERGMSDFSQSIFNENSRDRLSVDQYNACHLQCREFIELELSKSFTGKNVVISHHVPYKSELIPHYPHPHEGKLNKAFHVNLIKFFEGHSIDYWISGHTHFNHRPIAIGSTHCLTNQLGYVQWNEHTLFRNDQILVL